MSTVFMLVFAVAAPFWALMIVAPKWRGTQRAVATPWIATLPLAFWFVFAIPRFGEFLPAVASPTLEVWQELLAQPAVLTAVWGQIIAWDLFVGRWMYLDSRERDVHPLVMAPLLVLAIILSPIALPLYLALRKVLGRAKRDAAQPAERSAVPV